MQEEDLLGYLLGALDGAEHEKIRQKLQTDPQLQSVLSELEDRLSPL